MRKNPTCTLLAVGLVLCLPTALAGKPPPTATVLVDCSDPDPKKQDSINEALETRAEEPIIEIRGMCQEEVLVERSDVTLRGADPLADGITGPAFDSPNDRALVTVRGGTGVRFENLGITGSELNGMEIRGDSIVNMVNCHVTGNTFRGLQVNGSLVGVVDSLFADNGPTGGSYGIVALSSAAVFCTRCAVTSAPGAWGICALWGSSISFTDSDVSGDFVAACAAYGSTVQGRDTSFTANGFALLPTDNSEMTISGGSISGSVLADLKSMILLENLTQTSNPELNWVSGDTSLTIIDTSLTGLTYLSRFSNGTAEGTSALGDIVCDQGADFFCDPGVTKTSSTCGLCP